MKQPPCFSESSSARSAPLSTAANIPDCMKSINYDKKGVLGFSDSWILLLPSVALSGCVIMAAVFQNGLYFAKFSENALCPKHNGGVSGGCLQIRKRHRTECCTLTFRVVELYLHSNICAVRS
jgi:hypothetical protein